MFLKVSTFIIDEDKKEEFLDLMEEAQDIVLETIGGTAEFSRDNYNPERWIQINRFGSLSNYIENEELLKEKLSEIEYYERLNHLSKTGKQDINETIFEEFMSIEHEE